MINELIAEKFSLLSKLIDLHNENSFKAKSYANAAFQIDRLTYELSTLDKEKLFSIQGIGAGVGNKIIELLQSGTIQELEILLQQTPLGVMEIMQIKGVGPKKVAIIWKDMGIESIGELLYACNENRLINYKGFGEKIQASIKQSIEFYQNAQGRFLYAQVEPVVAEIKKYLETIFSASSIRVTGQFRRQLEIIDALEFVIHDTHTRIADALLNDTHLKWVEEGEGWLLYQYGLLLVKLYPCDNNYRDEQLFKTSGSLEFVNEFIQQFPSIDYWGSETEDDAVIFQNASIQYIPPYLREDKSIIALAQQNKLPRVITTSDIKGVIHNHSKWSDGAHTIEEMAKACIQKGYEYFVISDHSKIATYANGLTEEAIINQHKEIDTLNKQLAPFKIFKSIECDILNDGNLDYDDEVLASFDFVIASVHSNLKMDQEKAMQRLITAIENPYTSILGHPTGRLLLSREGYPLDMHAIIDACAANDVVIELNANPRRLDIDWRYIQYALKKNVLISINPDAHSTNGIEDIRYGVLAAQKAGVEAWQNLSCFSVGDFNEFLMQQYEKR